MISTQSHRPKIDVPWTAFDRSLERISAALLVLLLIATAYYMCALPETVPLHFDARGIPDRYGSKWWIIIFPVIAGFLYVLLTALNKYPHTFNYMVRITQENAFRQYSLAMRFMRFLKLLVILLFALIESTVAYIAFGKADSTGIFVLPAVLVTIVLPLIWYMVKSVRLQ
jgi:uncharacterized membrane protein